MENRRIIRDMHCVSNKLNRQLDNLLSTQGITHMQFAILSFITRYTKDEKDVFQKIWKPLLTLGLLQYQVFYPLWKKKVNKKSIRQK